MKYKHIHYVFVYFEMFFVLAPVTGDLKTPNSRGGGFAGAGHPDTYACIHMCIYV